ncbi:transglutaminase-like putative cysteine protease [Sphingopyxis panaciterrae]|uniref:transglutaminase-like domain-containing protein n=1 Tax=Sphingopyxis panaciterrae TaxID=363841 RepID=UPI001422FE42|nr:transglutaminase family protein [Sphingopyxis panaciterrae]NIJ38657.1 transglutaminase-like putative cysteine protease [Sphingopyxis panaciterrae]
MKLEISASLSYRLADPVDLMLQIEAAALPGQQVTGAALDVGACANFARIDAQDAVGHRIWLSCEERLDVDYSATVEIVRPAVDWRTLPPMPLHRLPAETVQYLNESRYCPSNKFLSFVADEFGASDGGAKIGTMRDWIEAHFTYVAGSSDADTNAMDSFVERRGVCRDYAHVMVTLARAAAIPARVVSAYAPGVAPQDFHAVAQVFLGGAGGGWHLVDATGMASAADIAVIGVGRDAADISFLTAYGAIEMIEQKVSVAAV